MKLTNKRLQEIIKEELRGVAEVEKDWSEELLEIQKNLETAIQAAWPGAVITVSDLEEQDGRDPDFRDEPPGGSIRVVWEIPALDAGEI